MPIPLVLSLVLATVLLTVVTVLGVQRLRRRGAPATPGGEAGALPLLDLMPCGVVIHQGGEIVSANRLAAAMVGAEGPESLFGLPVLSMIHPEDHGRSRFHFGAELGEGTERIRQELRLLRVDDRSELVVDATVTTMRLDGRPAVLATFQDITERKRLDETKSEFISLLSHELRTPVTAIKGSLGLLAGGVGGELPRQAAEMAEIALKQANKLAGLLADLLDIQQMEAGLGAYDLRPHALTELLTDTVDESRPLAEEHGVGLELSRQAASSCSLLVDQSRFRQIMRNLISNAIRFSPEGQVVDIAARDAGDRVRISVCDHGPGIPDDRRDRVFDLLGKATESTTTRHTDGAGVGLAMTRAIVHRLGGRIDFESEVGLGTTFFVELPLHQEPGTGSIRLPPAERDTQVVSGQKASR